MSITVQSSLYTSISMSDSIFTPMDRLMIDYLSSPIDNTKPLTVQEVLEFEVRSLEIIESLARGLFYRFNGYEYNENNESHQFGPEENSHLPNPPFFRLSIVSLREKAREIILSPSILDGIIG